ncbi:MAG: hypothetical protein ACPGVU_04895 [Limisphaerales bacterium]
MNRDTLIFLGKSESILDSSCKIVAENLWLDLELEKSEVCLSSIRIPCSNYHGLPHIGFDSSVTDVNRRRPLIKFGSDYYSANALDLSFGDYSGRKIHTWFTAAFEYQDREVLPRGDAVAHCTTVTRSDLQLGGIMPIAYAEAYLPLLRLPKVFENTGRKSLEEMYGVPQKIPQSDSPLENKGSTWMVYEYDDFCLRFTLNHESVTHFQVFDKQVGAHGASFAR